MSEFNNEMARAKNTRRNWSVGTKLSYHVLFLVVELLFLGKLACYSGGSATSA